MKAHKPSNDNAIEAVKEFLFSYRTAIKEKESWENRLKSIMNNITISVDYSRVQSSNKNITSSVENYVVNKEKLEAVMSHLVENLRIVAILIAPVMAETSNKILQQLGLNEEKYKEYDSIKQYGKTTQNVKVIEKGEPIFLRLDAQEEIEYIQNKMKS